MKGFSILCAMVLLGLAHHAFGYSDDKCVVYTDPHMLVSRIPINNFAWGDRIDQSHVCMKVLGEVMDNGWTPFAVAKHAEDCFGGNAFTQGGCVFFWKK